MNNITKVSISNKRCSFELSIHLWILKIKCITVSTKILCSTTVFNIDIKFLYSIFDQINAALVSRTDIFQIHKVNIFNYSKLFTGSVDKRVCVCVCVCVCTCAIRWCCRLITLEKAICMLPNTATTSRILSSNDGAVNVCEQTHISLQTHTSIFHTLKHTGSHCTNVHHPL